MLKTSFRIILCSLISILLLTAVSSCDKKKNDTSKDTSEAETSKPAKKNPQPNAETAVLSLNYEGILDMGKVYETEKKAGAFQVKNVSPVAQEIHSVVPTCECITLDKNYNETTLQPGESIEIKFVMNALTVRGTSYRRFIQITTHKGFTMKAPIGGWIVRLAKITPGRAANIGSMKKPTQQWSQIFEIEGNSELPETLTFGEAPKHPFFNCKLDDKGNGKYTLTVTPKKALPYTRDFASAILLPVLKPAEAKQLPLWIKAQVAESVNFAPDQWKIVRSKLESAGSLSEVFAYGEVPGVLEEKNDASKDLKNMMSLNLLRQHNAVPLKFVKEHHDWDDLFANLEFQVPNGVQLEKKRHPQGIEIRLTVKKEAFPEGTTELQVVPMRDGNRFAPIKIIILD